MYSRPEIACCTVFILLILLVTTHYRQLEKGDVSIPFPLQPLKPAKPIVMDSPEKRIQTTITINDVSYLVDERPIVGASVHITSQAAHSIIPTTMINVERLLVDGEWLKSELGRMDSEDDVFNLGFTTIILFNCDTGKVKITPDGEIFLKSLGTSWFEFINSTVKVPSGPYIWHLGRIFKVWRLYPDPNGAFIQPVIQNSTEVDRYEAFQSGLIPVPSRLYYDPPTTAKPLSGLRLAIKEIYDLKGVRTGCSVRDFLPLYPPLEESAVSIQKLIDHGAVIIGKTKTTQFASGEGSMDWVDFQCSFNPRGDGYQDTSMSSVGSAAGLASYDWIDSSLGTDTFGSILWPAAAQGIFGLRPTHNVLDNSGVLRLSEHLDTVGHFSRSVDNFYKLGETWFNGTTQHKFQLPKKILFPSKFWKSYQTEYLASVVEKFVQDLESVLGTERIDHDIESDWTSAALPPSNIPLKDYLATTLSTIQLYDCYHNNAKFRDDFEAVNGHRPYVNPMIRFKWKLGAQISKESYEGALERKNIFNNFLSSSVFGPDTIMLLPVGAPWPSYRDTYRGAAEDTGKRMQGFGFGSISFSALGGLPQVAFPIGQFTYNSRITEQQEILPAVISIVGAKNTDLSIIKLIQHVFEETNRPLEVATGKIAFPGLAPF